MRKLLYISANSKPEESSASKTVARKFINRFLELNPDFMLEELDLYKNHIPRLESKYFDHRNCVICTEASRNLTAKEQEEVETIRNLCDQFISADIYVVAVPMWSLLFPAPFKEYLDCVIQDKKTIDLHAGEEKGGKPFGLLDDKQRTFIYIQSSGAKIPMYLEPFMNKGGNYVESIMKVLGIKDFKQLLVDGTGYTKEEELQAIDIATSKIDSIISKIDLHFDS